MFQLLICIGLDTNLVVLPSRDYFQDYPRYISTLPQVPPVACVSSSRLVLSWWEREINIWRFKKQNASAMDEKVHKLAARIGLKGDENITSAAISPDGSFLVVSTSADVRLFQISPGQKEGDGRLKIHKVELEKPLGSARLLQISPDGKWLTLINYENEVKVARIVVDESTGGIRIVPKLIELERLTRASEEEQVLSGSGHVLTRTGTTKTGSQKIKTLTPLGGYARTVTRVQFSPDSRMLVASDLSGYIDSWILKGHEDPTALEVDIATNEPADKAMESDDENDDEDTALVIVLGQHWVRNPTSELLPKLESAPLLLSFRPTILGKKKKSEPNGNPAVHPTRNNPHPIAHDVIPGSYELVVLTTYHRLFEFDLSAGKLTDWSKRNPSVNLPEKFTMIKDRAMGCTWHVKGGSQRLWMYGSTWLFMFDLSQDFDEPAPKGGPNGANSGILGQGQKRKREDEPGTNKLNKDQIVGFAPKIVKIVDGKVVAEKKTSEKKLPKLDGNSSEEEEEDIEMGGMLRERKEPTQPDRAASLAKTKSQGGSSRIWSTPRYRPVLGMANIGSSPECLEMVVIERPLHELDLPPRFMAPYERGK
jgi:U3 small nucleolar RNA-associated protein 4